MKEQNLNTSEVDVNKEEKESELINFMVIDTEESSIKKKETWDNIFLLNPEFSDYIIALYDKYKYKVLTDIPKILIELQKFADSENYSEEEIEKIISLSKDYDFSK